VTPQQAVLRRLAPSRVALRLDGWKGAPHPDLLTPFDKAEAAYEAGDFANAQSAVELLAVRFAEPRWPSLPEPFKLLRVAIPAPMPPAWNPEHALSPPEREALRARRDADGQLALAAGSVAWAEAHGISVDDLRPPLEEARLLLATEGLTPAFYERIDPLWEQIRVRVPRPQGAKGRPTAPAPEAEVGEA
jgi:hypothetical protein